jgi:PPOX class probable F420-dependent enzyme
VPSVRELSDLPGWAQELLEETFVAHLGLVDESGHPRVQPITFARVGETLVSAIDDKPKQRTPARLARLRRDPRATVTIDRYDEDWTKLAWVQVLATAAIRDLDATSLEALQRRYPAYATPPPGPLIVFAPLRVLCWRAGG